MAEKKSEIVDEIKCPRCGKMALICSDFEGYYCEDCNNWIPYDFQKGERM